MDVFGIPTQKAKTVRTTVFVSFLLFGTFDKWAVYFQTILVLQLKKNFQSVIYSRKVEETI